MFLTLLAAGDITPDTSGYMIAGYAVIFGIMLIYLISLIVRTRNTQRDLAMFQDLDQKEPNESGFEEARSAPK